MSCLILRAWGDRHPKFHNIFFKKKRKKYKPQIRLFTMPNKQYIKGRRKEYKICDELKKQGFQIVQRTAGSHSPIDVIAIDRDTRQILFIQAKPDSLTDPAKHKLLKEMKWLNGGFRSEFQVR